jgi:hypothetical protein
LSQSGAAGATANQRTFAQATGGNATNGLAGINDFNPAAFTSLAYELVALSRNASAPVAAPAANATPAAAVASGNQSAPRAKAAAG